GFATVRARSLRCPIAAMRWMGFATVVAAAVGTCGAWWAGRERQAAPTAGGPAHSGQQITGSTGSVQLGPGVRAKGDITITVNPPPEAPAGGDEVNGPKACPVLPQTPSGRGPPTGQSPSGRRPSWVCPGPSPPQPPGRIRRYRR